MQFCHLHTHTEYSLLDGAASIKKLISRVKELGMTSCAITDHGSMYGVVDFYREAKAQGIHPVIGCEVYVAPRTRFDKIHELDGRMSHLILLAENDKGYHNLMKIVSAGYIEGFYYKPRIDKDVLREHSEGIIALSACLAGEIPRALVSGDYEGAKKTALEYIEILGKDNFFIEIQDHGIAEQKRIIPDLIKLAKELGLGIVATNDIHYLKKEDAKYQDILMCIQMGKKVNDPDRMKFDTDEFYLKSPEEMEKLFEYIPEAVENTQKIADRCNVEFDFNARHLPAFDVPDGKTAAEYLRELCAAGFKRRYPDEPDELKERLEYELETIERMGFVDYFLIVWDFINYAKNNGVAVGPGRGSAAGSIVSYCLEITSIDPIKNSLIFERFLNPERVSMPDIDVDFAPEKRQKVRDYVVRKYGEGKVAQIVTFGKMKAKLAVRDVGRALDIPYSEADKIAKLIPDDPKMTIDKALDINNELKALYGGDARVKELIDVSRAIEGLPRHASTHAAGVVITSEPMVNYVPLQLNNENFITTQFTKDTVESLGLLKMDFLGLRNLTVIENAINIIEKNRGIKIDINHIDFDLKEVYDLIVSGNVDGVFQLESAGMRSMMQEMRPACFEDITAGISLYRPGPMEQIPRYMNNRAHPEKITYKHPLLEGILKNTYGCMLYQEQVLEIVRTLAGYSLGKADIMRRTISKKKEDQMEIERKNFIYGSDDGEIPGCIKNGIDEATATAIFDEISDFANYGFNKSHAAAYAVVAYQTAYLKTFYPVEFMAALISSEREQDKINRYIENCREMGIDNLPPDVNKSDDTFTVEGNGIRYGLSAVKNVGSSLMARMVRERERNGKFKSFSDFIDRTVGNDMNKRALEGLIACGAFDSMGLKRSQLMAVYERALEGSARAARNNIAGQISLFDFGGDAAQEMDLPDIPEYDKRTLLRMEKDSIGMYLSGHPMDEYANKVKSITKYTIRDINESAVRGEDGIYRETGHGLRDGDSMVICAIIANRRNKTTRANSQMAFLTLEDASGSTECMVFPKVLSNYSAKLAEGRVVVIKGHLSIREDEKPKLIADTAEELSEALERNAQPKQKRLFIKLSTQSNENMEKLRSCLAPYQGDMPVCVVFADTRKVLQAPRRMWFNGIGSAVEDLKESFGADNVAVK